MSNILKPKRGKKATAEGQRIVLENGEVFFEMPDTGVGTGLGSIKFGDGTTEYMGLPYFFDKNAYAKTVHTHSMNDITNLNNTITTINENIADIVDGDTKIGYATNSDNLGGVAAEQYVTKDGEQDLTNKTYNNYTLAAACARGVDEDNTTETSTNLPTGKAVAAYVENRIGQIIQIRYEIYEVLPEQGEPGVIYLIPHEHGVKDIYDEYLYVEGSFEKIGNTDIDLSGYALVDHTHDYNDLLNLPQIPYPDNTTIVNKNGQLTGSRIQVLTNDPANPSLGEMWAIQL